MQCNPIKSHPDKLSFFSILLEHDMFTHDINRDKVFDWE